MDSTPAALVRLEHIGKRFANGTVALADLSLQIGVHQFVALLGPSGCGKSTVLRLIAGLLDPSSGRLQWHDTSSRQIGYVFQEPTLMPWATTAENLWLPLKLRGVSRAAARERVDAALAMVGLSRFAGVYPRELSGGMKMRVSIARALIAQPRVLLMDEPFAALDEITRLKLNDDVLKLWRDSQFTVVFVTHSVYESVYLAQRILVMAPRPGRVIGEFAIDEPYPRNEAYRASPRYNEQCLRVSAALRDAIGAGEDAAVDG